MGCDIEYDPALEASLAKKQYEREKAQREQELAYGKDVYADLKDLPKEEVSQDELEPFVRAILERSQGLADALPQLNGLDMNDSLGRNWQVSINKSEGTNNVWGISFRRMSPGCAEGHIISLLESSRASVDYVNWWMPGESMHRNNQWAIRQSQKRFDDLFSPLEKALAPVKRVGEPISDAR